MNLSPTFIAIFVAFMALGITFTIRASINAKKRTRALQTFAQENGLDFAGDDDSQITKDPTALFDRGRSCQFRNVMKGKWGGFEISVFDYQYITGSGRNSRTIRQTVVIFVQRLSLPLFELHPVSFANRVGDVFFPRDIAFDSNPEFSRRYMLWGKDKDAVRTLFAPSLLSYLETLPAGEKLHIEGNNHTFVTYQGHVQVPVENMGVFLDEMAGIASTFLSSCGKPIANA